MNVEYVSKEIEWFRVSLNFIFFFPLKRQAPGK
jgi:hypothetical protein